MAAISSTHPPLDYSVFLAPSFDVNEYCNAALAGEVYNPERTKDPAVDTRVAAADKGDVGVALARLQAGMEDVGKQLRETITTHHEALLTRAANVSQLSGSLASVRHGLDEVSSSVDKLRSKVRAPYTTLSTHVARLESLQCASDLLRRTARFVLVARRLEVQMQEVERCRLDGSGLAEGVGLGVGLPAEPSAPKRRGLPGAKGEEEGEKERALAKAALSIAELETLLAPSGESDAEDPPVDLREVHVISAQLPAISTARSRVQEEMDSMIGEGLEHSNQTLLASALQTAYNLHVLPDVVRSLLDDLTDAVEQRIREALNITSIAKEAGAKEPANTSSYIYRSRMRTEPTNANAPQWAGVLWARLERLVADMATCCIKVYTLEKVLKLKKDPVTQKPFMDEAMTVLEHEPSYTFWTTLSGTLETQTRDSAQASPFLQQSLSSGYPRLLRLFHDFFSKIAVHTDTVYTQTHQSPETVLVLRSISSFETSFLTRSTNRMNDAASFALSGGTRDPPGANEGVAFARTVGNELDSARFDPLLVRTVAKNVVKAVEGFVKRVENMVVTDHSATTLLGPTSTPAQRINASLTNTLYAAWAQLNKVQEDYSSEAVRSAIRYACNTIKPSYLRLPEPLFGGIRREIGSILQRLHRTDFGKPIADGAGVGGAPSPYLKDLVDKLAFIRSELLSNYVVGELSRDWTLAIARHVLRLFVHHASIARPLGESGKLKLTSDMTELEFALGSFVSSAPCEKGRERLRIEMVDDEYRALRGFRPLLFVETPSLADDTQLENLPPLILLHHILVRSPLKLPHELHGWTEAEYVRWVDTHSESERLQLVRDALEKQETGGEVGADGRKEFVDLARKVLGDAEGQ